MNKIRKLTDGLFVSPFVWPNELPAIAENFRTVINNRPDGEEPGQASSAELEAEARKLGLRYLHIPVGREGISNERIVQLKEALANEPGPVLAFCRSGTRSTALWALSQAGRADTESILSSAAAAGYDLRVLKPLIEHLAA